MTAGFAGIYSALSIMHAFRDIMNHGEIGMKIAHLADLHLGKIVNNYPVLEDQRRILNQIAEKAVKKEIDTIVIAGDIYDRPYPAEEAVEIMNAFLRDLRAADIDVFLIAGNHDSGPHLEFAAEILEEMNIHIFGSWKGKLKCTDLLDRYGPLHVYCLPYITPEKVNAYLPEEKRVSTFADAFKAALDTADIDPRERNILVAHQFFEGAVLCENGSEDFADDKDDHIPPELTDGFDYVALGHIHTPQSIRRSTVRYAGTPLNYTFEEAELFTPGFALAELRDKGQFRISTIELSPLHPMASIHGTMAELGSQKMREAYGNCRVKAIVEGEYREEDGDLLKEWYPYLMKTEYAEGSAAAFEVPPDIASVKTRNPMELLEEFYEKQNHRTMNEEQREYLRQMAETVFSEVKE